ncbi:hypothetical protein DPMN_105177 [Dreissena polymorpha]|uniref:Uncharacterized protein n=1 Tax=Dreissena polymorpha TaxID=45954 RepID=A0A9D4K0P7_DREPO|nr:hypothetical protein DPMN_105177 [Dreissena polymorpha]
MMVSADDGIYGRCVDRIHGTSLDREATVMTLQRFVFNSTDRLLYGHIYVWGYLRIMYSTEDVAYGFMLPTDDGVYGLWNLRTMMISTDTGIYG